MNIENIENVAIVILVAKIFEILKIFVEVIGANFQRFKAIELDTLFNFKKFDNNNNEALIMLY